MATRAFRIDSGGVARLARRIFKVDAGGTARLIKRHFKIDSGGVARLVYVGAVVDIVDRVIQATSFTPANAEASYRLTNAGEQQRGLNGAYATQSSWLVPSGTEGDYDVQVDMISGALTSGTTGTRLALSTTRTWLIQQTTVGVNTCQFTVTIRRTADNQVMDTATVTLEAEEA
jgi:hypothetical protein